MIIRLASIGALRYSSRRSDLPQRESVRGEVGFHRVDGGWWGVVRPGYGEVDVTVLDASQVSEEGGGERERRTEERYASED